jgi:hypothetical protein
MSTLRPQGLALSALLATLLVTGCEPPPVEATMDRQQQAPTTARIEGSVVVQGRARGNAVVFLYDATRPPPPQGTGRPVAFTLILQEELFGSSLDSDSTGPFTAPFVFPLVRPGRYLLRGFIDTDTCRAGAQPCHRPDFIPWYTVTAEPNLGDVAGAAVDPVTRVPRVIEVGVGADGTPRPVLGVTVSFSDTATVLVDRPAFEILGPTTIDPGVLPKEIRLRSRPIHEGLVDLRMPAFLVRFVDENGDGVPDDANGDNVPDLWPRVVVRKLADWGTGLTDENDMDNNGQLDPQGIDYVRSDGTKDGEPDLVVLAAGLTHVDSLIAQLTDDQGRPRMDAVLPMQELNVTVLPRALDARDPSAPPVPLQSMPPGRYAVIVIQSTGQVWRVPNELAPGLAPTLGLPSVESQGVALQVPASP